MTFKDAISIIGTTFLAVGGAGGIILGISSWLGKLWAIRIQEKDRQKYQKELEELKANYINDLEEKKAELEKNKILFNRYTENQFALYTDLYGSLYDLKIVADRLWERAEYNALKEFSEQLNKTIITLEKSVLLIEDKHYEQLSELFDRFANYRIGKTELINLRNKPGNNFIVHNEDIRQVIRNNSIYKEEYTSLIKEIGVLFKKQISWGRIERTEVT